VDCIFGTLPVDTAIFSDSLRGGHENDNVSRDFETASTSEKVNEPLSQIQVRDDLLIDVYFTNFHM
jgi:hypothetical protein